MKTITKLISLWAKHHKKSGAFLFTLLCLIIIRLSFILGNNFTSEIVTPFIKIAMPISVFFMITNFTIFKKRINYFEHRTQFLLRTSINFLFVIVMFINIGNKNKYNSNNQFISQAYGTFFNESKSVKSSDSNIELGTPLSIKNDGDEYVNDKQKIKFFLLFFVLLFATYLIGALACSIACSGFVVASVFVFYFAFVALVAAFYFLGKSTVNRLKRYRSLSPNQQKKNWLGVFGAGFGLWLSSILAIYFSND